MPPAIVRLAFAADDAVYDVEPAEYIKASGEVIFAALIQAWILCGLFRPEQIRDNALRRLFGCRVSASKRAASTPRVGSGDSSRRGRGVDVTWRISRRQQSVRRVGRAARSLHVAAVLRALVVSCDTIRRARHAARGAHARSRLVETASFGNSELGVCRFDVRGVFDLCDHAGRLARGPLHRVPADDRGPVRRPGCRSKRAVAPPRRGHSVETSRGDAAAATWTFRGGEHHTAGMSALRRISLKPNTSSRRAPRGNRVSHRRRGPDADPRGTEQPRRRRDPPAQVELGLPGRLRRL